MANILDFSEISMSRYHAAQIAVFQGFCQYFGLNMAYYVAISLHMTRYRTKTQISYVKQDKKQENSKIWKW